jgi:hypothetical protein
MDDSPKRAAETRSRFVPAYLLLFLAAGYLLSIGPAIGLLERGVISQSAVPYLKIFYAPLQSLQDNNKTAAYAFHWYCSLFVPREPPREPRPKRKRNDAEQSSQLTETKNASP